MAQNHQEIAESIVDEFIRQLAPAAREAIPQSLRSEMSFKIREALDAQSEEAAHQVEQLAKRLRQHIDRPQFEL